MKNLKINRIGYLLRNEIWIKWKLYALIASIAIILSFIKVNAKPSTFNSTSFIDIIESTIRGQKGITNSINADNYFINLAKYHFDWFPFLLFTTGFIVCSLSFYEYRKGPIRDFHLALPAHKIEKFLAKFLFSVILYPLLFLLVYQILANIIYALGPSMNIEFVHLGIFDPYTWKYIFRYMFVSTAVLALSSIFTRYSIIKSIILIAVLNYSQSLLMATLAFIKLKTTPGFHSNFDIDIITMLNNNGLYTQTSFTEYLANWGGNYFSWLCMAAVMILCILYSYYKFEEMES